MLTFDLHSFSFSRVITPEIPPEVRFWASRELFRECVWQGKAQNNHKFR
jgi:hypothetical protein